ncbi:proteasome subunit beta type-3-like [Sinocyclocheilus grahami]|uniref:proteasome subunit beta type-3-like n=1 Tax=Sinocyclocheilus grahami TaxID=75366 RepID=UPI0007AD592A|nr:PREDICTED: proteasome subunit beta type-3-like [Sinocyclocheilus grahami]
MSIMSYNGGAVMAMRGKECVAIASDRRFGIQAQLVTTDFQKIFPMGDRLYIGLAGLATDVQTVSQRLKFRLNLYELKEGRQIKPKTFMSMVSNLLYERRSHTGREMQRCVHRLMKSESQDLFETISQAMLNAVDRDAVSGMGVVVHVVEKDKITTRTLKARMD